MRILWQTRVFPIPNKVIDFGTNFLLVRHSNFGHAVLHHFRDIAGFLRSWSHSYSTLILGVFQLDRIVHVGVSPSRSLKLISREIIFQLFQPVWKIIPATYCDITAFCIASHGKNDGSSLNYKTDRDNMHIRYSNWHEFTLRLFTRLMYCCSCLKWLSP